jgi:hypothetical protein
MSIDSIRHTSFNEALELLEEEVEQLINILPENRELKDPIFSNVQEEGQYRVPAPK